MTESAKTPAKLCDNLAAAPLKTMGNGATVKATGSGSGSRSNDIKLSKENGTWKILLES